METPTFASPVLSREMKSCIEACSNCYQTCLSMAMGHCLEQGGAHVEPVHFRLMLSCAEICQTSANLQLSASSFTTDMCQLCATVCDACADSCRRLEGMEDCVHACVACAASCRQMSSTRH
jgi:hypothetical protein